MALWNNREIEGARGIDKNYRAIEGWKTELQGDMSDWDS